MKFTALVSLLVVGVCDVTKAEVSRAADAAVYRSGDFDQTDARMTTCPPVMLKNRHPDLQVAVNISASGGFSSSGARSKDGSSTIWQIDATSTGSQSSHVELRNKGATPAEIKEVWQMIEVCAKR
jgi:hypothetical protein